MKALFRLRNVVRALNKCTISRVNFSIHRQNDFDLVVIGGGAGGLAAAQEASSVGARVAIVNETSPTFLRATWGCVLKKVMHHVALLGEAIHDAKSYGWRFDGEMSHSWELLRSSIQTHLNSKTSVELTDQNVHYISGKGSFSDPHALEVVTGQGQCSLRAKYFFIALEGHPRYPSVIGAQEYGITSDDIFSLEKPPGKTIIIGANSVGLECAGTLNVLGYDTTVMTRSVPLKGLDQQMAAIVVKEMQHKGVKFLPECLLQAIGKLKSGRLKVEWADLRQQASCFGEFDTVMFSIGRKVLTNELHLDRAGVETALTGDKIEQTNVPHIFAMGDMLHSIHAGRLLSKRLFGQGKEIVDFQNMAITIFTPLQYGFVGFTEEEASRRFGEAYIEVYHSFYKPTEFSIAKKNASNCYLKVVALREGQQRVLGMHFVGPQAERVIQGFATAMKCGLTVNTLVNTVGIHPTLAEEFTKISITKRSGRDPSPASCCS